MPYGNCRQTQVIHLVIPSSLVETVLKLLHDTPQAGHLGRDRTLSMARPKYYWPTMRLDIEKHIAQCLSCAETKGTTRTAPILEYPLLSGRFDVVGIDLLQLPCSVRGSTYALVCVDQFSRFTVLAPLPNKSATAVAHAIVSHLICPYTTPRVLLSDNGTEFLEIRSFKTFALSSTLNRHLSRHTILLLMASLNALTEKSLRFYATLQDSSMKPGRTGFLRLLLPLMVLSILLQARHLTISSMGLTNAFLTMCSCTLLPLCTQMSILNYSFIASRKLTILFVRN